MQLLFLLFNSLHAGPILIWEFVLVERYRSGLDIVILTNCMLICRTGFAVVEEIEVAGLIWEALYI